MRIILWVVLSAGFGCADRPPLTPVAPAAPATVMANAPCTLTCITTDPADREVAYRFDWDQGDTSDWTAFLASGRVCTAVHTWRRNGAYAVRAQARNDARSFSGWSEPETVRVDSICRGRVGIQGRTR